MDWKLILSISNVFFFTLDVQAAPQFRPKVSEPINVQSMATAVQPCIKQLRPLAA